MKPRSRKIAVIATVVYLSILQRLISQVTLQNLMFLRERMMEDFVQESESLLFLTALLLSVHRRRGNFRHIRRRAWAWPRPQNWFDVMLASPRLNVLWKPNFRKLTSHMVKSRQRNCLLTFRPLGDASSVNFVRGKRPCLQLILFVRRSRVVISLVFVPNAGISI